MADIVPSATRSGTTKIVTCAVTNNTGSTIDITNILRGINIFNSLDSMVTSGWIEVLDQGNAIEEYSMNGQEVVDLEIHLNDDSETGSSKAGDDFNVYRRRFLVYAIEDLRVMTDQMMYRIKFIDPFALMNTDTRISWHFKDKKGEEIIKKIGEVAENSINQPYRNAMSGVYGGAKLSSSQKLFDFKADVSTQHQLDIYVPMMKPLELIRYLADRVVSQDNPCEWSDCLFYQDKQGTFHLNSFKNMFKDSLTFTQQIATDATQEKQHLIESYTFNKIYNIQVDKLNGIYGVQFAIADFKPTTKKTTQATVLGTNISAGSGAAGSTSEKTDSLSLHDSIRRYFGGGSLGPISLGDPRKAGMIIPFQADNRQLTAVQAAGDQGQQKQVTYNTKAGALIFMDACGIIHEDDNTYDEYKRSTLPYVTGCIMKKVLSTYVINITMNGAFDVDVGRSFIIKLDTSEGPKQMGEFVGDVIWIVSDVRHEWRSDSLQVKTYVTGFTPFLKRGRKFSVKA